MDGCRAAFIFQVICVMHNFLYRERNILYFCFCVCAVLGTPPYIPVLASKAHSQAHSHRVVLYKAAAHPLIAVTGLHPYSRYVRTLQSTEYICVHPRCLACDL